MTSAVIVDVGLLLSLSNRANDNFKSVATLMGGGVTSYARALGWASLTTLAGSLAASFLAGTLLAAFSGKGLVPREVVADPHFSMAVAIAGAGTVLLATRLGFPISTTHALMGGLVGAGWVAAPGQLNLTEPGGGFVVPLLVSPFIAGAATLTLYPALTGIRRRLGVEHDSSAAAWAVTLPIAATLAVVTMKLL